MVDATMTVTTNGATYSVIAVEGEDGLFRPDVARVGSDGGPVGRKPVDAEDTDESYADARTCLLRAMAHVV